MTYSDMCRVCNMLELLIALGAIEGDIFIVAQRLAVDG